MTIPRQWNLFEDAKIRKHLKRDEAGGAVLSDASQPLSTVRRRAAERLNSQRIWVKGKYYRHGRDQQRDCMHRISGTC